LMDEEGKEKTANNMIYIGHPIKMDDNIFEEKLGELKNAAEHDNPNIKDIVAGIVEAYHPLSGEQ